MRPGRRLHSSAPLGFARADEKELDGRREKHLASQGSWQSLSEQEEGPGSGADSEQSWRQTCEPPDTRPAPAPCNKDLVKPQHHTQGLGTRWGEQRGPLGINSICQPP